MLLKINRFCLLAIMAIVLVIGINLSQPLKAAEYSEQVQTGINYFKIGSIPFMQKY